MVDRYCSICGQELEPKSRFCGGCGTPLNQANSFSTPEANTQDHESAAAPVIPPDIEKAMTDLDASIFELDRVMRQHGAAGVAETFEESRQTVGEYIINNFSNNRSHSQISKAESGGGSSGFFFVGGMTSGAEEEEQDDDEGGWDWLGNLFS